MEVGRDVPFAECDEYLERLRRGPRDEAMTTVPAQSPKQHGRRGWCWTLRTVRATFEKLRGYTLSGVSRFLKVQLGVTMRSTRIQHFSPDPQYAKKVSRIKRCLHQTRDRSKEVRCVFLDEMGFYRWPEPARTLAAEPPLADRMGSDEAAWRVIAAMDALTGRVMYLDNYIVGRRQVIKFYEQLARAYRRVQRLYVIQDNWSIHTHPDVLEALQRWPNIKPIWLPTYAPWLNPIEKLWKWLRGDVLRLHRLAYDWTAVKDEVRDFLEQFHNGSRKLLKYVGLRGDGQLARCLRPKINCRL